MRDIELDKYLEKMEQRYERVAAQRKAEFRWMIAITILCYVGVAGYLTVVILSTQ